MAHVLTQYPEFYVDELTTTPVLLSNSVPGRDFIIRRFHTEGTDCFIGAMVTIEDDDLDEIILAAAAGVISGVIPDSVFNRRALEKQTHADWNYSTTFDADTELEVYIPINNIIVRANVPASNAITPLTGLAADGAGGVDLSTTSDVIVGRPLVINTSGTGAKVIAMILYGTMVTHAPG